MPDKKKSTRDRTVIFEIKTARPLNVGEQVFVTGDQQMLGSWRPDGLPLTRMGENIWSGLAILPGKEATAYKITRGTWDTEEVSSTGVAPDNAILKAGGNTTIRKTIAAWKDQFS